MGGRYSLWSAVGLPLAIALGSQGFMQLLQSGVDMDEHFAVTPLERNVPVLLGLLDVWNTTFLGWSGLPLTYDSASVTWGEVGSNSQQVTGAPHPRTPHISFG